MSLHHDTLETHRRYRTRGHDDRRGAEKEHEGEHAEENRANGPRRREKSGFSKRMEVFRRVAVMDLRKGEVILGTNDEGRGRRVGEVTAKGRGEGEEGLGDSVAPKKRANHAIAEKSKDVGKSRTVVRESLEISSILELRSDRPSTVPVQRKEEEMGKRGSKEPARPDEKSSLFVDAEDDEYVDLLDEKENRGRRGRESEYPKSGSREEPARVANTVIEHSPSKNTLTSNPKFITHGNATNAPPEIPRIPSSLRHAPPQQHQQQSAFQNRRPQSGLPKKKFLRPTEHPVPSRPARPPFRLSPTRDRDSINVTKSGLRTARNRQGIRADPFQDVWNSDALLVKAYRAMMDGKGTKKEKAGKLKKPVRAKEAAEEIFGEKENSPPYNRQFDRPFDPLFRQKTKKQPNHSSKQRFSDLNPSVPERFEGERSTGSIQHLDRTSEPLCRQKTTKQPNHSSKQHFPDPNASVPITAQPHKLRPDAATSARKSTYTISVQTESDYGNVRKAGGSNVKADAWESRKGVEEEVEEEKEQEREKPEEEEYDDNDEIETEERAGEEEGEMDQEEYDQSMTKVKLERELASFRDRLAFGLLERRKREAQARRRRNERIRERARALLTSSSIHPHLGPFVPLPKPKDGPCDDRAGKDPEKGTPEELKLEGREGTGSNDVKADEDEEEEEEDEEVEDLLESTDEIRTARPRCINEETEPLSHRDRREEERKEDEVPPVPEEETSIRRDFALPDETIERILRGRNQVRDCLRMKREGTAEPWKVIERIAEEFVQESIAECAREIGKAADDYVEKMIEAEMRPTSMLVT